MYGSYMNVGVRQIGPLFNNKKNLQEKKGNPSHFIWDSGGGGVLLCSTLLILQLDVNSTTSFYVIGEVLYNMLFHVYVLAS